ncbi:MAG: diaminopimelate epimerase [Bacteroidales bacterium]|nr:diaminopimelate epimerase [Bacteroidales bacterium]
MHGAGNDYIYVDTTRYTIPDPQAAAIAWSRPHTGIGSDGLVLIGRSPISEADFTMRIFNADGSEAMMCGNASRCIGKYVYERGLTHQQSVRLLTPSGIKILMLHVDEATQIVTSVTVDMGEPSFYDALTPNLIAPKPSFRNAVLPSDALKVNDTISSTTEAGGTFVSMGNPHRVLFVDEVESMDIAAEGARLERHPLFPERCNVEFAEMRPDGIRMRVWERGSGITLACGTGACATAVAAAATGRAGRCSSIVMDGGTLEIEWRDTDNHVLMTGPATFVFDGTIELP